MGQVLFAPALAGCTSDDVTASAAQVLSGYTALTKDSNDDPISGTMTNRGAWTSSSSGSGHIAIPAGYHNGSGYVDCSGAYNAGVTAADARANTSSANYKAGYNAGYANGQSAKAVGGMGAVYGFSGGGSEFSKTLPPGTYAWGVSLHSQYWCKYKVSHGSTVVGSNMGGAVKITDTGTFSISSNEKCSIWLQAYGGGDSEIACGYIVRIS